MVWITFAVVVLRYVYSIGWVWLQESYVWLHGIVFMVGAGYTLLHNAHVRVDIFYRPSNVRYKAMVDLFGSLLLLLPVTLVVTYASYGFVLRSEEHTSELQSLMRISYAVFCLKKQHIDNR